MSIPVYSTVFIALQGLLGNFDYTVPNGYVAVLRDVDIYASNLGPLNTVVRIIDPNTGGTVWFHDYGATSSGWAQWSGRQVFPEGEVIRAHVDNDPADVRACGYLLTRV
ncbi:MAG: hypothetical protein HRJ53_19240 [Acidobacteria bacterium Pan2503]|uniref:Uncharacterized protein n=1 Tax=Candidatus Acidiferrum panamense TaxID=2741543 RepID=A0A7V8NTA4_9BACT|nr:hypothetical protein [Candidatus Acidoferrum panamensis]